MACGDKGYIYSGLASPGKEEAQVGRGLWEPGGEPSHISDSLVPGTQWALRKYCVKSDKQILPPDLGWFTCDWGPRQVTSPGDLLSTCKVCSLCSVFVSAFILLLWLTCFKGEMIKMGTHFVICSL